MENEESNSDNLVPVGTKRRHDERDVDKAEQNPFTDPSARVRPSDYLRSRCPLCFGGEFPRESDGDDPDVIICLDACFTQKRNQQARDPPRMHPRTVFLLEQGLDAMEKYMDALRAHKPPPKKTKTTQDDEEDCIEGGLHVPNSVLDGCKSGFTAADERRAKASTQFFDDTALMALLCRHDIVLFLANMRSAGEKQHYVISLIETLFQHLPLKCHLGILYDIGCQVERSCVKGFGLSDGEGCERFWHSISKLIAYLRYHQRLYTLDRQVDYARDEIIEGLGAWLLRRSQHALKKRKAAELILQGCGHQEVLLRAQWDAQVVAQTKPLPRQSKKAGKDTVNELIRLRETQNDLKKRVKEYDAIIADVDSPPDEYADARTELESVRGKLEELRTRIRRKQAVLG
ncbi:hypothetical protein DXG01_011117, partial [Tephrocybe rancida]